MDKRSTVAMMAAAALLVGAPVALASGMAAALIPIPSGKRKNRYRRGRRRGRKADGLTRGQRIMLRRCGGQ